MNPTDYRQKLNDARQRLVKHYCAFRAMANTLCQKHALKYDKEAHEFRGVCGYGAGFKMLQAAKSALKLQALLRSEAMLLIELEASIQHEEEKAQREIVEAT